MKKKALIYGLLIALVVLLTACGKQQADQPDQPDTPSEFNTEETPTPEPAQEPEPEPEPPIPYTDVPEDASYYDKVVWAYENGVASDGSTFEPDAACTRAQVITFLWRAMGSPEPQTAESPFSDISSTAWYYKPVLWAYENNIVTSTTFNPDVSCNNAAALTFLWRAKGKPAAAVYSSPAALTAPDSYYARPVAWAENNGMFDGLDSAFNADALCRRADIVAYLYWIREQWTFTEEDKTVQAEYERIINDARPYEVYGSGLIYADYVDVNGDGKVELLTFDSSEDYEVAAIATVYANIDGHAGKACEETLGIWEAFGDELYICTYDGHLSFRMGGWVRFSGPYDRYYVIENDAILFNEYIEEYADEVERVAKHRGTAGELTEAEYNAINEKYTNQKRLFYNNRNADGGVTIYDRGMLPSPIEYWEAHRDQIYAAVAAGDFSYFAGYYINTNEFNNLGNAVLDKNGVLAEQYFDATPISITIKDSGVIHCVVREPTYVEYDEEEGLGDFYLEDFYDMFSCSK